MQTGYEVNDYRKDKEAVEQWDPPQLLHQTPAARLNFSTEDSSLLVERSGESALDFWRLKCEGFA